MPSILPRLASIAVLLCTAISSLPAMAADPACASLTPTGKLRAGMNLSNGLFTKRGANGELTGVSVDVMRELGARLGVPVEFVVYPTPGNVADAAGSNQWDAAILAIEATRAEKIAFSPPMTEIEATYAVRKDSPYRTAADVDAPGVRIAAADKAGYELYLTRALRNASLVRAKQLEGAIDVFNARNADAVAGLRPAMLDAMGKLPDGRLLEGNFMIVNHGIGIPRGSDSSAACIKGIVESLNASGFVAQSIARHGVRGLQAVKAQR